MTFLEWIFWWDFWLFLLFYRRRRAILRATVSIYSVSRTAFVLKLGDIIINIDTILFSRPSSPLPPLFLPAACTCAFACIPDCTRSLIGHDAWLHRDVAYDTELYACCIRIVTHVVTQRKRARVARAYKTARISLRIERNQIRYVNRTSIINVVNNLAKRNLVKRR